MALHRRLLTNISWAVLVLAAAINFSANKLYADEPPFLEQAKSVCVDLEPCITVLGGVLGELERLSVLITQRDVRVGELEEELAEATKPFGEPVERSDATAAGADAMVEKSLSDGETANAEVEAIKSELAREREAAYAARQAVDTLEEEKGALERSLKSQIADLTRSHTEEIKSADEENAKLASEIKAMRERQRGALSAYMDRLASKFDCSSFRLEERSGKFFVTGVVADAEAQAAVREEILGSAAGLFFEGLDIGLSDLGERVCQLEIDERWTAVRERSVAAAQPLVFSLEFLMNNSEIFTRLPLEAECQAVADAWSGKPSLVDPQEADWDGPSLWVRRKGTRGPLPGLCVPSLTTSGTWEVNGYMYNGPQTEGYIVVDRSAGRAGFGQSSQ